MHHFAYRDGMLHAEDVDLNLIAEEIGGEPVVILWEPKTRTASAYRPLALQPRRFNQ